MRSKMLSACVFAICSGVCFAEPPARPTVVKEEEHRIDAGGTYTLKKRAGGRVVQVQLRGVAKDYMLGVTGWADNQGFHVYSSVLIRDYANMGRLVKPADNVMVTIGGTPTRWRLERGEIITSINGYIIESLNDMVMAINTAPDKTKIDIEIYDPSTSDTYVGTFRGAKVTR